MRYDPPDSDFVGTEVFTYEACFVVNGKVRPMLCDNATVTIQVVPDPNKPAANPVAIDDQYSVTEGKTLTVTAPGFLDNDEHEPDKPIVRVERTVSTRGAVTANEDGSFEYVAPKCWTGNDIFDYKVCYLDYPTMCDEATVTIEVKQDTYRPIPAYVQSDTYKVKEGEGLDVPSTSGLLSNDGPDKGQEIFVVKHETTSSFEGDLKVNEDGSFQYTPVPGKLGSFWFSYQVCYRDWSPCVECREAMVQIVVEANPNKPSSPPTPVPEAYETTLETDLDVFASVGVLANDKKDPLCSLFVKSSSHDGQGRLKVEKDGSFKYKPPPDFLGTDYFTYVACYCEWPDLCATGNETVIVKPPPPVGNGDFSSRRGVATAYLVRWEASDDQSGGCGEVQPRLTFDCEGDGELSRLDLVDNSYSTNCVALNGTLNCAANNKGMVSVECRDGRANNDTNRQLVVTMESDPVSCTVDASNRYPMSWTYHAAEVLTYCAGNWTYQGLDCSGELLNVTTGSTVCYGDGVGSGPISHPDTITIRTEKYQQCVHGSF
jgi:Bacterial cadherin-like domain/Bacterial Ig domain